LISIWDLLESGSGGDTLEQEHIMLMIIQSEWFLLKVNKIS